MENKDSSPMLYCSGVVTPYNFNCFKGGRSHMFAHDGVAAFLSIKKKNRGYNSSPLLLFAHGVTVPWNFG